MGHLGVYLSACGSRGGSRDLAAARRGRRVRGWAFGAGDQDYRDEWFTRGPSVRVPHNDKVEFRWTAAVSWRVYVEVFDKNDGMGNLITRQESVDGTGARLIGPDHKVTINIAQLAPDTRFFFKVTMTDPTGTNPVPVETQAAANDIRAQIGC